MNTPVLIAIVAIVVVVAPVAFIVLQKRRTQALKHRFGLEYDRAIKEHGDKRKASWRLRDLLGAAGKQEENGL